MMHWAGGAWSGPGLEAGGYGSSPVAAVGPQDPARTRTS